MLASNKMKDIRYVVTRGRLSVLLIVVLLVIDQIIKILVKTNMCLGDAIHITDWFYIDFVENNGMAYGMTFINKFLLSLLRIAAICIIGWYIHRQIKVRARYCYIILLSMVFAGAAGNIFDSMFYGLVFDASTPFDVSSLCSLWHWLCSIPDGKGGRHVLFPNHRNDVAFMGSNGWWL